MNDGCQPARVLAWNRGVVHWGDDLLRSPPRRVGRGSGRGGGGIRVLELSTTSTSTWPAAAAAVATRRLTRSASILPSWQALCAWTMCAPCPSDGASGALATLRCPSARGPPGGRTRVLTLSEVHFLEEPLSVIIRFVSCPFVKRHGARHRFSCSLRSALCRASHRPARRRILDDQRRGEDRPLLHARQVDREQGVPSDHSLVRNSAVSAFPTYPMH